MESNQHLLETVTSAVDSDTKKNLQNISEGTCKNWGGIWTDKGCQIRPTPLDGNFQEKTVVQSPKDALAAFEKYTSWFEYILEDFKPTSDSCVLLPCGATKPIGCSSIHQKKLSALNQTKFSEFDIIIISEPCTIVPHEYRLHLPPVNYEFPPEYTKKTVAEEVFEIFTDRIAEFIDSMGYSTYYPYLVEGHQVKFDEAIRKSESNPEVVEIPGASLSLETNNYSGDLFKSVEDVIAKLKFIYKSSKTNNEKIWLEEYSDDVNEFYNNRDDY